MRARARARGYVYVYVVVVYTLAFGMVLVAKQAFRACTAASADSTRAIGSEVEAWDRGASCGLAWRGVRVRVLAVDIGRCQ